MQHNCRQFLKKSAIGKTVTIRYFCHQMGDLPVSGILCNFADQI